MLTRTEHQYGFILGVSVVGVVLLFGQLLQKYTFVNLFRVAEVCSDIALQFNYTTFHTTGRLIGIGLGIITTILIVKIIFSIVKTQRNSEILMQSKTVRVNNKVVKICKKLNIPLGKVMVIQQAHPVAITLGFFDPKIVLSTSLLKKLNDQQLSAVLLHENHHFTRRHPVLFLIGEIITQSFSFLPILKEVNTFFQQKLEREADQFAIISQKTDQHVKDSLRLLHHGTNFSYFPAFTTQPSLRAHKQSFTWKSLIISFSVFSSLLTLTLMPVSVEAQTVGESMQLRNCSGVSREECMTYCQSSGLSFLDFQKRQSVRTK